MRLTPSDIPLARATMKITAAEPFLLKIPTGREMADSMQSVLNLEIVGILVTTDAGITGTGYTITVGHGGSVIREVLQSLYAPELCGRDPFVARAASTESSWYVNHRRKSRVESPAPQPSSGRNRFQRPRPRASRFRSSRTGGW